MNRAVSEMLHCLNSPGNNSGDCTDMTVLERQRARMKWQEQFHEQQEQEQNYYCGNDFGVFSGNQVQNFQSLIGGETPVMGEVVTPAMKPDPGLENGWPELGRIEIPNSGFGTCGYGNGSGYELNYAIMRTSSCPPVAAAIKRRELVLSEKMNSGVERESFKKRKTEKVNTKVPVEDDTKSKKLKGCAEGDSKITEQNSYQNNTNNREISADTSKENSKVSEVQKPDYIHVRARRGQATDSHSLAERVRREKISERMKYLQDLVPGCNKITGKAGMLDEIINYVQSLQRQVEFLSMKLTAVNPTIDFNIDNLFAKEVFPACTSNFPTIGMSTEISNPAYLQFNPVSCCGLEIGINPPDIAALRRTISAPISIPEPFVDSSSFAQIQPSSAWDADLQNFCNVEFHPERSSGFPSQHFTGSIETSNIKMEM